MSPQQKIASFVRKLLSSKGDHEPFTEDEPLLSGGRLESIDAVELVVFLEEEFGVDFVETGFDQSKIDSVQLMAELAQDPTTC
jgi:acyl carrier protein